MNSIRSDWRFFHNNAGYVVGQRAIGAWNLMKAERYAMEREWGWSWDWDDCADNGPRDWGWSESDIAHL